MKRTIVMTLLMTLFLAGSAGADPPEWDFDPAHCGVYFDIRHIFSTTRGHFDSYSGTFAFDPEDLKQSSIEIEVEVASVDTNVQRRDDHLRSKDFFHVSEYPKMSFQSSRIRSLGGDRYEADGTFRIKDVSREITVPFTFHGIQESPLSKGTLVAGFDARFSIDRLTYHVGSGKFYELGVVGKTVDILLSLEMVRRAD